MKEKDTVEVLTLKDYIAKIDAGNFIQDNPLFHKDARGAPIRKGTRVRKAQTEETDYHKDGALGTVVGSLGPSFGGHYAYFVEFDDCKGIFVFIREGRVEPVETL